MNAGPPAPERLRPALDRLAAAGATGALRVSGAPGGTIWLVNGEIRYAETPAMPGVGERLTATGRISNRTWNVNYQNALPDGQVARRLVDEGHLTDGELTAKVRATVYDAAYVMLADDAVPARFHTGLRHWLGDVTAVGLADLHAEITRRRLLLSDPPAPAVPLTVPAPAARPATVASVGPDGPAVPIVPGPPAPSSPREPAQVSRQPPAGDGVDAASGEAGEITAAGPGRARITAVFMVAGVADEPTGELPIIGSGDGAAVVAPAAPQAGTHRADAGDEGADDRPAGADDAAGVRQQAGGCRAGRAGGMLPRRHPDPSGGAPARAGGRTNTRSDAGQNGGQNAGPDYATLRRIRIALKSIM